MVQSALQEGLLWSLEVAWATVDTAQGDRDALCEAVRGLPEACPIFWPWSQKVLRAMCLLGSASSVWERPPVWTSPSAFCSALRLGRHCQGLAINRTRATNRNLAKTTHSGL